MFDVYHFFTADVGNFFEFFNTHTHTYIYIYKYCCCRVVHHVHSHFTSIYIRVRVAQEMLRRV